MTARMTVSLAALALLSWLPRLDAQVPDPTTYYPLHVGDTWTFSFGTMPLVERVVAQVQTPAGPSYRFDALRSMNDATVRMAADGKLSLDDAGAERLWLDFGAKVGDSWRVNEPGSSGGAYWDVTLESKADTLTVPAGSFTDVYRFTFRFNGADGDWMEYFASGVGPIRRVLYGIGTIVYDLVSYEPGTTGTHCPPAADDFGVGTAYPLPARALVSVPLYGTAQRIEAQVLDLLGRDTGVRWTGRAGTARFDVSALPAGTYVARFIAGSRMATRVLIVGG